MSESVPSLPDDDDPWVVLGAQPGDDLVALRRRYVRLIKVFRPEAHPEEFARIRSAWEQVQADVRLSDAEEHFALEARHGDEARPADDPPAVEALRRVWTAAAELDYDRARRELAALAANPEHRERAWAHRFLLEEAAGAREPTAVWRKALESQVDVGAWMEALLDPAERRRAGGLLDGGWKLLRVVEDRDTAARLLRARVHDLVWRGRDDDAVAEVEAEAFRTDALDRGMLGHVAREVATSLAVRDPKRAGRILADYPAGAGDENLDACDLALGAADAAAPWLSRHASLTPLVRFLRLTPIADDDEALGLCLELWTDFLRRPDAHVEAFGSIPPPLASIFLRQVSELCDRHDVVEPRPPHDLDDAIRTADRHAWPSGYGGLLTGAIIFGLVAGVGAFKAWGWLGLVGEILAALVGITVLYFILDSKAYAKRVRPALARYEIESGASPVQIALRIRRTPKLEHLDSMVTDIEADVSLQLVYAATRLGDLLPALEQAARSHDETVGPSASPSPMGG